MSWDKFYCLRTPRKICACLNSFGWTRSFLLMLNCTFILFFLQSYNWGTIMRDFLCWSWINRLRWCFRFFNLRTLTCGDVVFVDNKLESTIFIVFEIFEPIVKIIAESFIRLDYLVANPLTLVSSCPRFLDSTIGLSINTLCWRVEAIWLVILLLYWGVKDSWNASFTLIVRLYYLYFVKPLID